MTKPRGAMTIAEGRPEYKTDVDIIFNNGRDKKEFVLRTTKDPIDLWKTRHSVAMAGFKSKDVAPQKWAARIDKDYWVFGIDATRAEDIFAAVKIGMKCYNVKASDLISDVYVKNLNAEHENAMGRQALVTANQKLYEDVSSAIMRAAKLLGVQGTLNFYIFSNNKNPKIPKENLHMALRDGGADSVETDDKTKHKFNVMSNDGSRLFKDLISHMHLAKFKV